MTTEPLRGEVPVLRDEEGYVHVAIIGSRSWPASETDTIEQYGAQLPTDIHVHSGESGIVDLTIKRIVTARGMRYSGHPVNLEDLPADPLRRRFEVVQRYYARDRAVARDCYYLVAFWNPFLSSGAENKRGGTRYTVKQARELQKPVLVFLPKGIDPRRHRI